MNTIKAKPVKKLPKRNKTLALSQEAERIFEKEVVRLHGRARKEGAKLPKKGEFLSSLITKYAEAHARTFKL